MGQLQRACMGQEQRACMQVVSWQPDEDIGALIALLGRQADEVGRRAWAEADKGSPCILAPVA